MASNCIRPGTVPRATHHELRTAENSAGYLLTRLSDMKGKNPSLCLLDVGAGSGTISSTLAKAVPEGRVVATDLNPDILERARAVAEAAGITNIEFSVADVLHLPYEDEVFDITHCHQVLAHLGDPVAALKEMLRVTKRGGIVAAREGDFQTELIWPSLPGLVKFHDFVDSFLTKSGGSATAGRQLLSWALAAGATRNQIIASCGTWSYSEPAEKLIWAQSMVERVEEGGWLSEAALAMGLATKQDLDEMAKAWRAWPDYDDGILGMMQGEVLIQK